MVLKGCDVFPIANLADYTCVYISCIQYNSSKKEKIGEELPRHPQQGRDIFARTQTYEWWVLSATSNRPDDGQRQRRKGKAEVWHRTDRLPMV